MMSPSGNPDLVKNKSNNHKRKASIYLECSSVDDANFTVDSTNVCETVFKKKYPFACIGGSTDDYKNLKRLIFVIIAFVGYLGVGYVINNKKNGDVGFDAIPN